MCIPSVAENLNLYLIYGWFSTASRISHLLDVTIFLVPGSWPSPVIQTCLCAYDLQVRICIVANCLLRLIGFAFALREREGMQCRALAF